MFFVQATNAGLNPAGVTMDAIGNLFIADYGNFRVRKVYLHEIQSTTILTSSAQGDVTNAGERVVFTAIVSDSDVIPDGIVTFMGRKSIPPTMPEVSLSDLHTTNQETPPFHRKDTLDRQTVDARCPALDYANVSRIINLHPHDYCKIMCIIKSH
jgi:hypothetical protein